ncbi:MAG: hypothetical protein MUD08_04475 [Cytophagales bacterium]|jgi:hypothetical protein|nr:hypothetical protein [Cytophagales bacterium]
MRLFCFLFAFVVMATANATRPQAALWHKGEIQLLDNQWLDGEVSYDVATDLLQVRKGSLVRVYTARQVNTFGYFDTKQNTMRRFVSLPQAENRFWRGRRQFYEIVLTGEMYLLRRPRNTRQPGMTHTVNVFTDSPWYDSRNIYNYYVYRDKRFTPIRRFRKEIFPAMVREFSVPLQNYMREKDLDIFTQRGQFMLINQYNVLKNPDAIVLF